MLRKTKKMSQKKKKKSKKSYKWVIVHIIDGYGRAASGVGSVIGSFDTEKDLDNWMNQPGIGGFAARPHWRKTAMYSPEETINYMSRND